MDPWSLAIGGGMSLLGGLFGGSEEDSWENYWNDVNYSPDMSRLDEYGNLQDFGQNAAWGSYNKAGLLGTQMAENLGGMHRDELRNIQRATMDMAPTAASLRGVASAQGAGGQMSNVLARQQRSAAQSQAGEAYGQQAASASSRYQQNLLSSMMGAEQLRQGAMGQYLGAQGAAQSQRGNIALQRTLSEADIGSRVAIANAQGRSQAKMYANRDQENPWLTTGLGILGQSFASRGGNQGILPSYSPGSSGGSSYPYGDLSQTYMHGRWR